MLEVGDGVFEVLSTAGDTHLGGDDFDKVRNIRGILCSLRLNRSLVPERLSYPSTRLDLFRISWIEDLT